MKKGKSIFRGAIIAIAFLAVLSTWGNSAESRPERQHEPTTTLEAAFAELGNLE